METQNSKTAPVRDSNTALVSEWELDPSHSAASFSIRHMLVSTVRGGFDKVTGTVTLDERDPTRSQINVTIDPSTINTREAKRDGHLKSADFFDVAQHPAITFKSTKIEAEGVGAFQVTGDLTMHGVTHPVTLAVEAPTVSLKDLYGRTVRGVSATGKLNRKDWGLGWNQIIEAGGVLLSEDVKLQIDAELVAKAPGAKQ